ncbi:MAG: hypothetical protein PHN19_05355 [Patescibacteria group bacterium]|nr:hypothetical protein [Patescibacteria group bacterium]
MEENKSMAPVGDSKDVEENKIFAVLSYLGVLVIVPLLAKKDSKFAMFHAKQGLVLMIGWVISWLLSFVFIGFILDVIMIVFSIWGIVNAATGKFAKLPVIGDLAEKFKF